MDDFRVRVATVQQGQDVKGVVVEVRALCSFVGVCGNVLIRRFQVEYNPCQYLSQAEPIIQDFVEQLKIPQAREFFRPKDASDANAVEEMVFTLLDTGRQYMELLRMR